MIDDSGRFCAQPIADGGPELLISLCCNAGHVVVGVEKGSSFTHNAKLPGYSKSSNNYSLSLCIHFDSMANIFGNFVCDLLLSSNISLFSHVNE